MRTILTRTFLGAAMATVLISAPALLACPFCEAPSLTLTEQLNQADAAALVQWVKGEPADREKGFPGTTTYEVIEVVHDSSGTLKPKLPVVLDRYRAGKKGDLFLLLGTQTDSLEWSSPLEVTETAFQYMKQAPTKETPTQERLAYFMQFLEYSDPMIATDAYGEFANAPYEDITPLAKKMPVKKLRQWIQDENTPATRLGLYGLMLGLAGTDEDAELMKKKILEPTEEFRLGIDGIMGGYLVLTGEEGLAVLDKHKLQDETIPFSETYAAMQALRFMWTYGDGRISKQRLRASMRILLDRPELADLVITDLARWQDWSVTDRLMELYGQDGYDIPSIKRAIVRFFLVAEKAKTAEGAPAPHAAKAAQYLATLRETDPKTVKAAERFFFVN
ncbi:MAG: hypothetical protein ACF8PG_01495 [Maioricimonas sp. JB045]|uniref:hypothetical protein n=1 Tax=Maioricimonas sp. JC845 TaxID=3232138 RepID=UPI00345AFD36